MTEQKGQRRGSRGSRSADPLPPASAAELLLAGRSEDEALDSDSRIRCALTRLAAAVLDGRVDRGRANAAMFIVSGIAQRLDREFERQARLRELDLREREIETARELSERLAEFRSVQPGTLVQVAEATVHLPGVIGAAARGEAPALEAGLGVQS